MYKGDSHVSDTQRVPDSEADTGPQAAIVDAAPPGVVEAMELYEAAMRHYAVAAAYTVPVHKTTSTSAARAASFAS